MTPPMTPEEWQRVRPILESALELAPSERASFLDEACSDASLRHEVESLILSHDQAGDDVLDSAPIPFFVAEEARFRMPHGMQIGAYEIVEELAQGGMGAVYRAIRADGQYKQQVALKIVRADMGVGLSASRFRNERQILASLDHPNIAKILDGGATADGLPYFVMEFIDGLPITDYCDRHKLTIETRLGIFRRVCSAVHYAHQRLVIHRDIKPGNILITSEGVPKLLDFGIAKILDPALLLQNTTLTAAGSWIMTPEYASPEQLQGKTITTATDVYSLGLVLYELLAGRGAYRFANRMPHEVARAVLETDPEKPSTAIRRTETPSKKQQETNRVTVEDISNLRSASPEKLGRRLSGDLDNIVLKAIRKEPPERYASADQLSEDVRRHLEGLPVLARKSTVAYRCRKYVLRHKFGVASAALLLLTLLSGIVSATREARIARANQIRAEQRFNDVRKLANSLMFEIHDSIKDLPGATNARKILASKARDYLDSLSREARGDPSLQHDLAAAYDRLGDVFGYTGAANLGDFESASQSYAKALAIRESLAAAQPQNAKLQTELADEYFRLATSRENNADFPGALKALERAQPFLQKASAGTQDPALEDRIGGLYFYSAEVLEKSGDSTRALENFRKAASFHELIYADSNAKVFSRAHVVGDYNGIARTLVQSGRVDEAIPMTDKALAAMKQLSDANPANATLREYLAETYKIAGDLRQHKGDWAGALENTRNAHVIFQQLASTDPSNELARENIVFAENALGYIQVQQGHTAQGLQTISEAIARIRAGGGSKNLWDATALGSCYSVLGAIYSTLAVRATSRTAKIRYWREARSAYQEGLGAWSKSAHRSNTIDALGRNQSTLFAKQIATCDAELGKITVHSTPRTNR